MSLCACGCGGPTSGAFRPNGERVRWIPGHRPKSMEYIVNLIGVEGLEERVRMEKQRETMTLTAMAALYDCWPSEVYVKINNFRRWVAKWGPYFWREAP